MKNSGKEKFVLITGGSEGIGLELAKCFAEDGYNLLLAARSETNLERVCSEINNVYGVEAIPVVTDLFDIENTFELYDEIKEMGIQVEVLVNNAGQGQYGEFSETDIERELNIIQLNISSVVILTKLFLKDMLKRGEGKILNVSSVASKLPGPLQSVYHGTKAFVQSFTSALRNEVKDKGIIVTALLPGATDTDFFNKAEMLEAKNVVNGDLADPADVARDGYKALMKGEDMVISGFMNKVEVGISNLLPDSAVAKMVHNQQAPVSEDKKNS